MAKVKIILEKNETKLEAEEKLLKALEIHKNGSTHKEDYLDPAMVDLTNKITQLHKSELNNMMEEIFELLDSIYSDK